VCQTSADVVPLFHLPTFDVVQCCTCGMAFVNEPVPDASPGLGIPDLLESTCVAESRLLRARFRRSLAHIEALAPDRGKLLDVGCGEGYFLSAAQAAGWQSYGIELDKCRVDVAVAQGLNVEWTTVEQANLDVERYDVITMFHVIEHLNDPVTVLRKLRSALKPDGLLVVETPTNDFPLMSALTLLYRLSGGRFTRLVNLFYTFNQPWGHQYRHCRRSLTVVLEKTGFRVLRIDDAENAEFRLFLRQRNYGQSRGRSVTNALLFAPVFAAMRLPGMNGRMIAYAVKEEATT